MTCPQPRAFFFFFNLCIVSCGAFLQCCSVSSFKEKKISDHNFYFRLITPLILPWISLTICWTVRSNTTPDCLQFCRPLCSQGCQSVTHTFLYSISCFSNIEKKKHKKKKQLRTFFSRSYHENLLNQVLNFYCLQSRISSLSSWSRVGVFLFVSVVVKCDKSSSSVFL